MQLVSNMGFVFFLTILVLLSASVRAAAPPCEFEDSGRRRISGDNPKDLECIKVRAAAGDEFQQYYLGLILIGQVPGPENISEGLATLTAVALRNNKYSADAMRFIGYVYKRSNTGVQDYELAYQWLYLASQQPGFKETAILLPDETLGRVISPARMKELERDAPQLLRNR